jgi:hypothetical protein
MIFFRRPGVIHVDCFTHRADVFNFAKIDHARKFIPEWWKKLPKHHPNHVHPYATMKTCPGFVDLFQKGIILPLWSDLSIILGETGTNVLGCQFVDEASEIVVHDVEQRGSYLPENKYQHIKLRSPWVLQTKKDLDWSAHGISWCHDDPFLMLFSEGIVNFKWQPGTNVNFFLKRELERRNILINAGQPLLQFIPLTEKKIVLHHQLVDEKEVVKITSGLKYPKFVNGYSLGKKILQQKESKCPFGFK